MLKSIIRPILIGVIVGALGCLAVLFVLSIVATGMTIPPLAVVPLAILGAAFGAFFGGWTSAKVGGRNGWLVGSLTATMLFIISMLAGLGLFSQMNMGFVGAKFLVMLACGMTGGVIAVNFGKHKRR